MIFQNFWFFVSNKRKAQSLFLRFEFSQEEEQTHSAVDEDRKMYIQVRIAWKLFVLLLAQHSAKFSRRVYTLTANIHYKKYLIVPEIMIFAFIRNRTHI